MLLISIMSVCSSMVIRSPALAAATKRPVCFSTVTLPEGVLGRGPGSGQVLVPTRRLPISGARPR